MFHYCGVTASSPDCCLCGRPAILPTHGIQTKVYLELIVAVTSNFHGSVKSSASNILSNAISVEKKKKSRRIFFFQNILYFPGINLARICISWTWRDDLYDAFLQLSLWSAILYPSSISRLQKNLYLLSACFHLIASLWMSKPCSVFCLFGWFSHNFKWFYSFRILIFYYTTVCFSHLQKAFDLVLFFNHWAFFWISLFSGILLVLLLVFIKYDLRTFCRNVCCNNIKMGYIRLACFSLRPE